MQVIKQINNNAAVAIDGSGSQVVILGSGLGFGKMPYELNDLSRIERTFYELDDRYIDMFSSLPNNIVLASADLIEQAELVISNELNPNLVITLADHLNFAISRMQQGINIAAPLSFDIQQLYSKEYYIGLIGLDIVEKYTNIRLDDSEAASIALHLINGEFEKEDLHSIMSSLNTINGCTDIISDCLHIAIDKKSFAYNRFLSHLRYLMKRMEDGEGIDDDNERMLKSIQYQYPEIYECALKIARYLEETYHTACHQSEILYLTLHINRMKEKTD